MPLPRVHQVMGAAAVRLLGGGAIATLRMPAPSFNYTTLERTTTYTDYTVPVVVHRMAEDADGSVVKSQQLRVSIPGQSLPAGIVPAKSSLIVIGGITHRVLSVDIATGDGLTVATYDLDIAPVAGADVPAA